MISKKFWLVIPSMAVASISIFAQPRPTPTPARPTATPTPARPTATPARPTATPTPAANLTVAVPPAKIAVVDTEMFADDKGGIFRLVDAIKVVQAEFRVRGQELETMQTRLKTLVDDIQKLRQAPAAAGADKTIQAKQEEGTRLQQDFTTKKQRFDEDFTKRYREVTGPITDQIGKSLDEFARANGITMTLDLSKLLPAVLTALPTVEVTAAFIADFNRKFPRTGPPR